MSERRLGRGVRVAVLAVGGNALLRSDDLAVGKQVAGVVEGHDAVAEEAPALLGVAGHGASGVAIRCVR